MTSYSTEVFHVDAGDYTDLVGAIGSAFSNADTWVNVEPVVDDSQRIEVPGIFAWFSARGPQVPIGTFVSAGSNMAASVGLNHGTGRGASERLIAGGVGVPERWVLKQDHPRTGLVWEVHPLGVDAAAVARLLLEGTSLFCPISVEGQWIATLHQPS